MNNFLGQVSPYEEEYFTIEGHNFVMSFGHQLNTTFNNKLSIVLDGMVYNYVKLKESYFDRSEYFETNTDAEVVLKLYEKMGIFAFSLLEGTFVFSIYDKEKGKIFLVRDFFGEKQLYYSRQSNEIYWSSELKSIISILPKKPQIDIEGLNLFFQLTYIPAPYTIYNGVEKLEPYNYIEISCESGFINLENIQERVPEQPSYSFDEAKRKTVELVENSVKSRLVADGPVGAFLSGGVDSSIVSLCAARCLSTQLNTFSIGFEKKSYDETEKSKLVSQLINSNHHELIIKEKDLQGVTDKILLNFEEPFADSSAIPSYIVADYASKYVKIALTGDGGDEVFGGYNKYYMGILNKRYVKLVPESVHRSLVSVLSSLLKTKDDNRGVRFKLNKLINGFDYNDNFYFNIISLGFHEQETKELLLEDYYYFNPLTYYELKIPRSATLHDFQAIDRVLSLEGDLNVKVNKTAKLASIETRSPFLNKDIWNFTMSLSENYLLKGINKKFLLKKAFENEYPEGFFNKKKQGFGIPVGDWLRCSLSDELKNFIDPVFLTKQAIFNITYVTKLVNDHIEGRVDNTFRVWTFFCFQKWYKNVYCGC